MTDAMVFAELAHGLVRQDWMVWQGFLPPTRISALAREAEALRTADSFRAAGIGRGAERHASIRGDEILWVGGDSTPQATSLLRGELEALRLAINAATYLGLEDFEGHYAAYPAGATYAPHVDGFSDNNLRMVSFVLYLNEAWGVTDGGALRLYPDGQPPVTVEPKGGTLVCFLSERVRHEVLPAVRTRLSLSGWFRRRA